MVRSVSLNRRANSGISTTKNSSTVKRCSVRRDRLEMAKRLSQVVPIHTLAPKRAILQTIETESQRSDR